MKSRRTNSARKALIHAIAHCRNCDWMEEWYKSAARKANQHMKETGHTVDVEQGYHYEVKPILER